MPPAKIRDDIAVALDEIVLLEEPHNADEHMRPGIDGAQVRGLQQGPSDLLRPQALKAYYEWLRGHVEKNTPWDELARELGIAVNIHSGGNHSSPLEIGADWQARLRSGGRQGVGSHNHCANSGFTEEVLD